MILKRVSRVHGKRWKNALQNFPFDRKQVKSGLLFIHIPKTGGSSLIKEISAGKHRSHYSWLTYYRANRFYFDQAFKFAFVRHTESRVVSIYNHLYGGFR